MKLLLSCMLFVSSLVLAQENPAPAPKLTEVQQLKQQVLDLRSDLEKANMTILQLQAQLSAQRSAEIRQERAAFDAEVKKAETPASKKEVKSAEKP